jgi:phosphonate transport system substrate-binding protein
MRNRIGILFIFLAFLTAFLNLGRGLVTRGEPIKEGKEKPHLTIALIPEEDIFEQRKRYNSLANYIGKKLSVDVKLKFLESYGDICKEIVKGRVDAAFFGSFTYAQAHAQTGVEPIARPVWPDGSSTYSGYIFVRKDSGIKGPKDMREKRLVLVHKATTAGYIFPLDYFAQQGISDINSYFKKVVFVGRHDYACWSVYIKEADVGAAKNHIFNDLAKSFPKFKQSMLILAESSEVPSNGLAVRRDIESALKLRLKEVLLNLNKSDEGRTVLSEFGAIRFIQTSNEDYRPLYEMLQRLNINLEEE